MSDSEIVVAVYDAHSGAEQCVKKLQASGFDMKKLSIVGKNPHTEEHVVGFYNGEILKGTHRAGLHTHSLKSHEAEHAVTTT